MYKSFTFKRVITLFIAFIFIFASVEHFMFFASNSPELPQMLALTNTDNNNYPQRDTDYLSFTVYGDVLSVYHAQVQRLDGSIWQDIGTLANGIITIVNTAPYHAHVNFTIPSNILEGCGQGINDIHACFKPGVYFASINNFVALCNTNNVVINSITHNGVNNNERNHQSNNGGY